MQVAKVISIERNENNGRFKKGSSGGPGRGHLSAKTRGRAITRAWYTKTRLMRLATDAEGDAQLSKVMGEFAKDDPGGYCRWVSSLTPDYPTPVPAQDIMPAGFSPQDLIEQIETARLQASAIEQPTIVKPNVPDPDPEPARTDHPSEQPRPSTDLESDPR